MPQLFSTSRAEAEIYRYPRLFHPLIVILALVIQAYLPQLFHSAVYLDFPLLVVGYIALTSRNQATAMVVGCLMGLLQDILSSVSLGLHGIAQTIAGFLASSLGARIDADHPGVRLLVIFCLYWIDSIVVWGTVRFLMARPYPWNWRAVAFAALLNGIIAMFLFRIFDRFRERY